MKILNLIGKRFTRLIILEIHRKGIKKRIYCKCQCDCGRTKNILYDSLRSRDTKSCGCLQKEIMIHKNKVRSTHRHSGTKTYECWHGMIQRCTNPKDKRYKNYGGRVPPITVCERWSKKQTGFISFLEDVGEIPKGLTLDRINNDSGYHKENCRLSTMKEQSRNKRNNNLITYKNKTQCLSAWAEEYNINVGTLRSRLYESKWSIKKALTTIIIKRKK